MIITLGIQYLKDQSVDREHPVYRAMLSFEDKLQQSATATLEESVPGEMMEVFSDGQWPQLLFEFQPSMAIFAADFDLVGFRQDIENRNNPVLPVSSGHGPREECYWLIYSDQSGQLVRSMDAEEYRGLWQFQQGHKFTAVAANLWPRLDTENQHHKMTELLLKWLSEGLVIDAGVALPPDAEFEDAN